MPARNDEKAKELIGKKFGKLTVMLFVGRKGNGSQKIYLCKCDCGNDAEIYGGALKRGATTSCGCVRREVYDQALIDLTGKKFGIITVIERDGANDKGALWKCLCDCGQEKIVGSRYLRNGQTKSCGCQMYYREHKRKYEPKYANINDVFNKRYSDGNLTIEQFLEISQMNCHYCGVAPSNNYNKFRDRKTIDKFTIDSYDFLYNGLDRIDNTRLHDLDNCVPCCKQCGTAKLDYTVENFREWIVRLHKHYIENS